MARALIQSGLAARGERVRQVQAATGLDGKAFVVRLQQATDYLGLSTRWYEKRLSTIATGKQDLSLEDIAVLEEVDPLGRSWHWIAFGVDQLPSKRRAGPRQLPDGSALRAPGKAERRKEG